MAPTPPTSTKADPTAVDVGRPRLNQRIEGLFTHAGTGGHPE